MKSFWTGALVFILGIAACGDGKPSSPAVSSDEASIQAVKRSLAPSLSRSTDGLVAVPLAGGGERVDLQGRFQSAAVAKIGADGKLVTDCVDSVEAAEAFLRARPPAATRSDR